MSQVGLIGQEAELKSMLAYQSPPYSAAIVVVNFKTASLTIQLYRETRRRLAARESQPLFIVIDNNSGPEDAQQLVAAFGLEESVKLMLNKENLGYSGGNNQGLRYALKAGIPYSLILNSDVEFTSDEFLDKFICAAEQLPRCGLIGPRIVLPSGREQAPIAEKGIWGCVWGKVARPCEGSTVVYGTIGCCVFGSTRVFARIGFLDENIFLYREEEVLAEKLKKEGLAWWYLPSVQVVHRHERKLRPFGRLIRHKKYEWMSTRYFLKNYRHVAAWYLYVYDLLFAVRFLVFIMVFGVLGLIERRTTGGSR